MQQKKREIFYENLNEQQITDVARKFLDSTDERFSIAIVSPKPDSKNAQETFCKIRDKIRYLHKRKTSVVA